MSTTPAPITRELIKQWSENPEQLKKEMRDPARLAEINAFLAGPERANIVSEVVTEETLNPVVEQVNADQTEVDAAAALATQAEADRVSAEQARSDAAAIKAVEDAAAITKAYADAGVTVYSDDSGNITKLVQAYQALDDAGNPVGRPTHLEARSWVELAAKQREAHTQVARAFNRLKSQKTTFRAPVAPIAIPEVPLMSDKDRIQAALDLSSDDEAVVIKADRRLRADQILKDQRNEYIRMEEHRQNLVSDEFKQKHVNDFNPCQANAAIITGYLKENNLEWTIDNLELAFAATEPQLAAKETPVAEVPVPAVVANPPAAVPSELPPTPVVTIQPTPVVAEVPPAPVVAAVPAAPAARPGVNAGLIPGQLTAARPVGAPVGLTKKDIGKMSAAELRKRMANPAQKAEIYKVLGQKMS